MVTRPDVPAQSFDPVGRLFDFAKAELVYPKSRVSSSALLEGFGAIAEAVPFYLLQKGKSYFLVTDDLLQGIVIQKIPRHPAKSEIRNSQYSRLAALGAPAETRRRHLL